MRKPFMKWILTLMVVILSLSVYVPAADAASGSQGYAVYRDGVYLIEWHSGLMVQRTRSNYKPVVHAVGFGSTVKADHWSNFRKGKNFKGVYRPKKWASSYTRDVFVGMARNLARENIPYNLAYQMYYNTKTAGTWVNRSEITSMRCDGLVEYIYEWYGYKVFGSSKYWDITKNSYWGRNHHSGTKITPKKQVNYLTKVSSRLP